MPRDHTTDHLFTDGKIQIEERRKILELMSRTVAHDFQNLLLPVATLLELIEPKMGDDERKLYSVALRNLEHVRSWLAEAVTVGALDLDRQHTTSAILISDALEGITSQAKAKNVQFRKRVVQVGINVDRALCAKAIGHLLSNAVAASPTRGYVDVDVTHAGGKVMRVTVTDGGSGIAEDLREYVGRPFFSTKRGKNGGERGFGLGLSVSQQIAAAHGGELRWSSTKDGETQFVFEVPVA